jgi:hypothetical protein
MAKNNQQSSEPYTQGGWFRKANGKIATSDPAEAELHSRIVEETYELLAELPEEKKSGRDSDS